MSNNVVTGHDELTPEEIAEDGIDDVDAEFANMDEEEFESFLTKAICEFAEENSAPELRIDTFYGSGLLTKNHGLVVQIGEAKFHVTIVRSR